MMNILLTNDDGYQAPALHTLANFLFGIDDVEIEIIAPTTGMSAQGMAITINQGLKLQEHFDYDYPVYSLNGSACDCVKFALFREKKEDYDLIISGINHGINTGNDTYYSSTFSAALEAHLHRYSTLALSAEYEHDFLNLNYENIDYFLKKYLIRYVEKVLKSPRKWFNINIPHKKCKGVLQTQLAPQRSFKDYFAFKDGLYYLDGQFIEAKGTIKEDYKAVKEGYISITKIKKAVR